MILLAAKSVADLLFGAIVVFCVTFALGLIVWFNIMILYWLYLIIFKPKKAKEIDDREVAKITLQRFIEGW